MRGLQQGTGAAIKGGVLLLGALTLVACASTAKTTEAASAMAATEEATENTYPDGMTAMEYLTKNVNKSGVVRTVKIDGVEKRCKRQKQVGTNLKKTICMTEAEWAKLEEDSRELTKKFQRTIDLSRGN